MDQDRIIVGIGASAGGLEAIQALVGELPKEPGMVFLVAMHLDPSQPSSMVELLARSGPLRVETPIDDHRPDVDTMYVAPPGVQLKLAGGRLRLEPNGKTSAHPIDSLFRSLADDVGPRAVGIVLSGSGTDGAQGLAAIRAVGGSTFAQDHSASFPSMPRAAIDRGVVDRVLSPTEIAHELRTLGQQARRSSGPSSPDEPDPMKEPALAEILAVVRARRSLDFTGYKAPTLLRRVHRRMVARRVDSAREYIQLLEAEPSELDALVSDILINVTEFFRDPDVFEKLASKALPRFDQRELDHPLRVWVAGCSSGQEAYSIAMLILEHQAETGKHFPIKLFATDVDDAALTVARLGCYSAEQCASLSPARRKQFFVAIPSGYQIHKSVRDLCVFARHDLTRDPPFSRIDILTCRNVLIYFDAELQRRVIPFFHYALNPGGVFMLGKAESIGTHESPFEVFDGDSHMYVSRVGPRDRIPDMPMKLALNPPEIVPGRSSGPGPVETRERQADQFLLDHYTPPAVIIDDELRVTEFRGDTSPYLVNSTGAASFNLLKLARHDLLAQLSIALETAKRTSECSRERVHVRGPEREVVVNLRVVRLDASGYLVLFENSAQSASRTPTPMLSSVAQSYSRRLLLALERYAEQGDPADQAQAAELETTRRRLHELIEEHEAKTEELKAANEEVLSSNEELQSTNEELQTTKEEIQATNEELITVNEELKARNGMLAEINDDLNNLLSSTNIPIVMVSQDRRIRRFTPSAGRLLNLIASDVGRPLDHIKPDIDPEVLESLLEVALEHLQIESRDVQDRKGSWYQVAVRPYRTADNKIDGAVISIVDIDDLKRAEQRLRVARDYAESVIETVHEPLIVVGDDLRIVSINHAFATLFTVSDHEVRGRGLVELGIDWADASVRAWIERAIRGDVVDEVIDIRFWPDSPRERVLTATVRPITRGERKLFLIAMTEVTAVRQRERREIELINSVLEVQAREREHLAHELHDETGQALSAVLVGLSTLAKDIGDEKASGQLRELRERVRELIDSISRIARGLHPAALDQLGLCGALHQLIEHFTEVHAIPVDLRIDHETEFDALPTSFALGLFRVMQEALTNIARHADASEVRITLTRVEHLVQLRIADDGEGFDVHATPVGGLGLRLMERRVGQLGGSFRIESASGGGTRLAIDIPVGASA